MCILKGFSRLVMRTDVKDRFISETFSFRNNCVEKACLVLCNFGRKFNSVKTSDKLCLQGPP